jgi:hypothetical protein
VGQEVANRHRALARRRQEAGVIAGLVDAQVPPLGNQLVNRIVELKVAVLVEHHERHGGDGLRHRVDAEDRVLAHGLAALAVHQADR